MKQELQKEQAKRSRIVPVVGIGVMLWLIWFLIIAPSVDPASRGIHMQLAIAGILVGLVIVLVDLGRWARYLVKKLPGDDK